MRQQLGDITSAEVSSINHSFGKESPYYYRKAKGEPAKIVAYRKNILWVAGSGALGVAYTMIYHRKGTVWWIAPFIPLVLYVLYNRVRPPVDNIGNCYRFIIAKRTATAQMVEHGNSYS